MIHLSTFSLARRFIAGNAVRDMVFSPIHRAFQKALAKAVESPINRAGDVYLSLLPQPLTAGLMEKCA
jgi:hypothetical protein